MLCHESAIVLLPWVVEFLFYELCLVHGWLGLTRVVLCLLPWAQ